MPIKASAFIVEALKVASTVTGIIGDAAAGKASRALAEARRAEFQALINRLDAIDSDLKVLDERLKVVQLEIRNLPTQIDYGVRFENSITYMRQVSEYATNLTSIHRFDDQIYLKQQFDKMNIVMVNVDRDLLFFRDKAASGDLRAMAALAVLQEAVVLSMHATAIYSVNEAQNPVVRKLIELLWSGGCSDETKQLEEELGIEIDCSSPVKSVESTFDTLSYISLLNFLEDQERFWADSIRKHEAEFLTTIAGYAESAALPQSPVTEFPNSIFKQHRDLRYQASVIVAETINSVINNTESTAHFTSETCLSSVLYINWAYNYVEDPVWTPVPYAEVILVPLGLSVHRGTITWDIKYYNQSNVTNSPDYVIHFKQESDNLKSKKHTKAPLYVSDLIDMEELLENDELVPYDQPVHELLKEYRDEICKETDMNLFSTYNDSESFWQKYGYEEKHDFVTSETEFRSSVDKYFELQQDPVPHWHDRSELMISLDTGFIEFLTEKKDDSSNLNSHINQSVNTLTFLTMNRALENTKRELQNLRQGIADE